jgi:hypothetical protein
MRDTVRGRELVRRDGQDDDNTVAGTVRIWEVVPATPMAD